MKLNTRSLLLLAPLFLVACDSFDKPAGHARVTRFSSEITPAPVAPAAPVAKLVEKPAAEAAPEIPAPLPEVKKPEPARPVVSQQQPQPDVSKPVPAAPELKTPERAPKPIVSQQQPVPAANQPRYHAPSTSAGLPLAPRRKYPLMPGQSRALKALGY